MSEQMLSSNANLPPNLTVRISKQMKLVLKFLADNKEHCYHQTEIIKALYGGVTPSKQASMSRTIKTLKKAGLVNSRKAYYSPILNAWILQRIIFFITDEGLKFLKEVE